MTSKTKLTAHVPSNGSPSYNEDIKTIARHLEQIVEDEINAYNNRDFSPTSPIFSNKHPDWFAQTPAAANPVKRQSLLEFVEIMRAIPDECPDYTVKAVSFSTTVDASLESAEVFMNAETTGLWEGVSKRHVIIHEFRKVNGVWLHSAHRAMTGMDIMTPL